MTTTRPIQSHANAGNRFSLDGFTGSGYSRGRGVAIQLLWLMSRGLLMKWWCPNAVRITVLRLFGARIAAGVIVRHQVKIHWPWKLAVGRNSWIGEEVWILNLERLQIGSNTCISQGALLCTGSHDRHSATFEFDNAPVVIGDSVWVAARATVLRGVHIGDGATVGATAVVAGDVPAGATVLAAQPHVR
ncbi:MULTISPECIES: putative colanic acid biosynthesis acetyltransferase [Mycolicibacterium]|uniref:Colanic acid biosynthesis acetyltransferase n=1 Tax=Mycolicibacterium porcinum TaxID=39693 RepID=A0ABV3V9U6_9MYCO|nr:MULTISPECIES: putative colanic acid biosynthesis acetyltransferase [Mycolicibacterium]QRY52050.1 putative colanic acid biosynthesis acetyltransferase [Mycolicibacterium septicum]